MHVLHVSAHGGPGELVLEDDDGNARPVDADTFVAEAIPPGAMPPVIALAACHTDVPDDDGGPSFAGRLAECGAWAVIGTETSVTDRYATRLFARVYAELAEAARPDVVRAVADARRMVQRQLLDGTDRRDQLVAGLDEWSVVTVLAGAPSVAVYDPAAPSQAIAEAGPGAVEGLLTRPMGEFVGRRREQRALPAELAADSRCGRGRAARHRRGRQDHARRRADPPASASTNPAGWWPPSPAPATVDGVLRRGGRRAARRAV